MKFEKTSWKNILLKKSIYKNYLVNCIQLNQQLFVPLKKRCKTQAKGLILFKLVLIDRGSLDRLWGKKIFPKSKKVKKQEEKEKMTKSYFRDYYFV